MSDHERSTPEIEPEEHERLCAYVFGELEGDERAWLRTGDLGRLATDGQLVWEGRLKDLIIVRGQNHHPHDLEQIAELTRAWSSL